MHIEPLTATHRPTVNAYVRSLWGGPMIVSVGNLYDASDLPGFVATDGGALYGFALYRPDGDACEVAALLSLIQGAGVGARLMDAVKQAAADAGAKRLWLVTTNDDTRAIRFYQKYGFTLEAVNLGAFEQVRKLKNELPARGDDDILIEHEFVFGMPLQSPPR